MLDCPSGGTQACGDIGLWQVGEMEQHDGVALPGRKLGDRRGELVRSLASEYPSKRLVPLVCGLLRQLLLNQPPGRGGAPDAQTEDSADAGQPRTEPFGVAQLIQLQPGDEGCVLRHIGARVAVAQLALARQQEATVVA